MIGEQVRRFREGDPSAAQLLAARACRLALRTAGSILESRDEAADVAQDVAVDVLRSLRRLREPEAFDAWVHRITVRRTLRVLRRRRNERLVETPLALLPPLEEPAAADGPDPMMLLAARQALAEALAQLPPRQRVALALRYVHDLPDAEIAAALGCRLGTAHSLLSRGRESLRRDPKLADLAPIAPPGGPA